MGKKSSSAPQIDPRYYDAIERQTAVQERQQQWYEDVVYPQMIKQYDIQNQNSAEDRALAQKNAEFWQGLATTQTEKQNELQDAIYKRWRDVYVPVEDRLNENAARYNEGAESERQAQAAIADIDTTYAAQRQALGMQMGSYGVNPLSGAYQAQNRYLLNAQAAQAAQAANSARQAADELGWNKNMQLAALGQNYLNAANQASLGSSSQAIGASQNALAQANQYGQQGLANLGAMANIGLNSYAAFNNGWGDIANSYMQGSTYNYNAWAAQQSNKNALQTAGLGAGGMIGAAGIAAYAF